MARSKKTEIPEMSFFMFYSVLRGIIHCNLLALKNTIKFENYQLHEHFVAEFNRGEKVTPVSGKTCSMEAEDGKYMMNLFLHCFYQCVLMKPIVETISFVKEIQECEVYSRDRDTQ